MAILFISDLHLDAARPRATARFLQFLARDAAPAEALYILGDLFETWVGDDDVDPHHREVVAALHSFTRGGRPGYFCRGNRDFLLGPRLAAAAGLRLLDDVSVVSHAGRQAVVMHGDLLCTDDRAYQRFRSLVRQPWLQQGFLALPLSLRAALARWTRRRSATATARKPAAITDVSQAAVEQVLRRHGLQTLIHGHTHRPGMHEFELDGAPARRIVLGDWYEQGSALWWDSAGFRLAGLPFD